MLVSHTVRSSSFLRFSSWERAAAMEASMAFICLSGAAARCEALSLALPPHPCPLQPCNMHACNADVGP